MSARVSCEICGQGRKKVVFMIARPLGRHHFCRDDWELVIFLEQLQVFGEAKEGDIKVDEVQ